MLPLELLLDEPFYQLVRQQLLAKRLEHDRVLGAEVVRVLHVLAPGNTGYQDSLARAEHRALGSTVDEVWTKLLRTPDRFVHVDPRCSSTRRHQHEYVDRYSPAAACLRSPSFLGDIIARFSEGLATGDAGPRPTLYGPSERALDPVAGPRREDRGFQH